MSLETEVKKLTAAMVQMTDAFNEWRSQEKLTVKFDAPVDETPIRVTMPIPTTREPAPTIVTTPDPQEVVSVVPETTTPPPAFKPEPAPEPTAEVAPTYTFEQVNTLLGSIAGRMGDNGAAIRALMAEYDGAGTIMQIPPEKYGEVVTRAQALPL